MDTKQEVTSGLLTGFQVLFLVISFIFVYDYQKTEQGIEQTVGTFVIFIAITTVSVIFHTSQSPLASDPGGLRVTKGTPVSRLMGGSRSSATRSRRTPDASGNNCHFSSPGTLRSGEVAQEKPISED